MDIKAMAEAMVQKLKANPALLARFGDAPVPVIEELLGVDLPDDVIETVADIVKTKLDLDKAGAVLKGLGGLFK